MDYAKYAENQIQREWEKADRREAELSTLTTDIELAITEDDEYDSELFEYFKFDAPDNMPKHQVINAFAYKKAKELLGLRNDYF